MSRGYIGMSNAPQRPQTFEQNRIRPLGFRGCRPQNEPHLSGSRRREASAATMQALEMVGGIV
jgi:hypothetical protein